MKKITFTLPFILLSCFGEQARKNMQAENLVLNHCEYVIQVLNTRLNDPVPDSLFVTTCGCISGILREDLVNKYEIASLEKDPKRLEAVLSSELFAHLALIRRECLRKR